MEKIINSIEIENVRYYIKSTGETRRIKIRGTRGAGFSIEINDSSGTCILEEPLRYRNTRNRRVCINSRVSRYYNKR